MTAISFSSPFPKKNIYAVAGDTSSVPMQRDEDILVRFCGEPGVVIK